MDILQTPDDRFVSLPNFGYSPSYVEIPSGAQDGPDSLRMGFIEAGSSDADPVLLLHGEPSWSFLYRKMIPVLLDAGHRVVVPDLIGFGRSDKPTEIGDHTYARHVTWMTAFVEELGLRRITLFCQDWGGLIGLRVLAEHPDRFARTVAANTGLPVGNFPMPDVWQRFRNMVVNSDSIDIGRIVESGCVNDLTNDTKAAYNAPFPDESYKAGPRAMPDLIPQRPDDPSSDPNRAAWKVLSELDLPFMVAFSDSDPITAGSRSVLIDRVHGAQNVHHPVIADAGHFLQEDAGHEVAETVVDFIAAYSDDE